MKKTLVFGGTGFFGKKLVEKLIARGDSVTLVSRNSNPFGDQVTHFTGDRTDNKSLAPLSREHWDIVFDQICYCSKDAQITSELLDGKVGKYILTSTGSVYSMDTVEGGVRESAFDPLNHKLKIGTQGEFDYGEGKRQAEAYFFQNSKFDITAVRFPIVIGEGDTSKRLDWHIERIKNGSPVFFPNLEAEMSFVSADDAARSLIFFSEIKGNLQLNVHSSVLKLQTLILILEEKIGRKLISQEAEHSPYGIRRTWTLNSDLASGLGFKPQVDILDLLKSLV